MDIQTVINYLEGNRITDVNLLRRATLREGPRIISMSDEDVLLHELASEGTKIIVPVLRLTLQVLKIKGEQLALVLKKTAELSAALGAKESGRRNFQSEMEAGRFIDGLYLRPRKLINDIALASPQQAEGAGRQIEIALHDNDRGVRALAAIHATTTGIPAEIVSGTLINLLDNEREQITRYAVASALIGLSVEPPSTVAKTALDEMYDFLHSVVFWNMPALVSRMRDALKDQSEGYQNRLIADLAVHYAFVL